MAGTDEATGRITMIWQGLRDAGMPEVMLYLPDGTASRCHWDNSLVIGTMRVALLGDQERNIVRLVAVEDCNGVGIPSPKGTDPMNYRTVVQNRLRQALDFEESPEVNDTTTAPEAEQVEPTVTPTAPTPSTTPTSPGSPVTPSVATSYVPPVSPSSSVPSISSIPPISPAPFAASSTPSAIGSASKLEVPPLPKGRPGLTPGAPQASPLLPSPTDDPTKPKGATPSPRSLDLSESTLAVIRSNLKTPTGIPPKRPPG